MTKRAKLALLVALTLILVVGIGGTALAANSWSDLSTSDVAAYGITLDEVGLISDGFTDGTWKPYINITRAQFVKMAVEAYGIPLVSPSIPTYDDVPPSHQYYQWIEAATAAGLTNGVGMGLFKPDDYITREQAAAIIVRWVAQENGYDPETMYTDADVDAILAAFPDAAQVSNSLKKEIAFGVDFGIIWGTSDGKIAPHDNLLRLQGAALIIRSWDILPAPSGDPAGIIVLSDDKTENLIGQTHTVVFQVIDDEGVGVSGVLVDFDTLWAEWYVGNVSSQAALTGPNGEISVNLISTEPGTQRVSASVRGEGNTIYTTYTTKYWLVLDEVYILDPTREAENNAGEEHTWAARTVVFGPGPLSTSPNDWYNAYDPEATGILAGVDWPIGWAAAQLNILYHNLPLPGYDVTDPANWAALIAWAEDFLADNEDLFEEDYDLWSLLNLIISTDRWTLQTEELAAAFGYLPRTLAGIGNTWTLSEDSVGIISQLNGVIISPSTEATAYTDEWGVTSATIISEEIGDAYIQVVADYPENPYPGQLYNHFSQLNLHFLDWDDQPQQQATAVKTWIPHVIGGDDDAPIVPAYAVNNTGEVEEFVLTLEDVYGNPIEGYTVEWWIQGVGFFKTDGTTWVGPGEYNKDVDLTDANGQASVLVKSVNPGQTIVHAKVMDKYGLPWKEWNVVKQWYSIDDVEFIDAYDGDSIWVNEVGTEHTFTVQVSGAKWVYTIYDVNQNGLRDDQVLIGDRADLKAAEGYVLAFDGSDDYYKDSGEDLPAGRVLEVWYGEEPTYYTRFAGLELGYSEFWHDHNGDGVDEVWSGLAGKGVNFFTNVFDEIEAYGEPGTWYDDPLDPFVEANAWPEYVGSIIGAGEPYPEWYYGATLYDYDAVTDELGMAWVTISSVNKGYQYVYAVADYPANPQDGDPWYPSQWNNDGSELRVAEAIKLWTPVAANSYAVFNEDLLVGNRWTNPVNADYTIPADYTTPGVDQENPNWAVFAVQVFDEYGNALEGYKVTWEIVDQGGVTAGAVNTYHPYAHFADWDDASVAGLPEEITYAPAHDGAGVGDLNPFLNENPWWGERSDGTLPLQVPDAYDANLSWGWTLNSQIDFDLSFYAAAYTVLVLDEDYDDLQALVDENIADHFTSIVNVQIWTPENSLWAEFEVTKVWMLEEPVVSELVIEQSFVEEGDYTTDPLTVYDDGEVDLRVAALNQWGGLAFADPVPALYKVQASWMVDTQNYRDVIDLEGTTLVGGWAPIDAYAAPANVTVTFQAWYDADDDDVIDAGELQSNQIETTFVGGVEQP